MVVTFYKLIRSTTSCETKEKKEPLFPSPLLIFIKYTLGFFVTKEWLVSALKEEQFVFVRITGEQGYADNDTRDALENDT